MRSSLLEDSQTFTNRRDEVQPPVVTKRGLNGFKIFPVLMFQQAEPNTKVLEQKFCKITRDDFLDLIRDSPVTTSANGAAPVSARDLHSLDPTINLHGPSFFVRKNAVLVNLNPFKAVVVANKMFLLLGEEKQAHLPSMLPEVVGEGLKLPTKTEMDLGHRVPAGYGPILLSKDLFDIFNRIIHEYDNSSFATNALETLLCAYSEFINAQYAELRPMVMEVGSELIKHQSPNTVPLLDRLKMIRNLLDKRHGKVTETISALDEVLASPETMAQMQLGLVFKPKDQPFADEIELLFDTYLQAVETTLNKLQDLRNDVDAFNDIKMIHLDQTRNTLLRIELIFSLITSLAGVGALVAGIFGMNLNSYVQEDSYWFWTVTGLLIGILVFGSIMLIVWFRMLGLLSPDL